MSLRVIDTNTVCLLSAPIPTHPAPAPPLPHAVQSCCLCAYTGLSHRPRQGFQVVMSLFSELQCP